MDYAQRGTRVNAVVPGNHQNADASPTPDQLGAMCPLVRMAEISDILDTILSL
jgi:hypothetical protein